MSLPVSSSYYFEPLWQLNMSCEERRDNTRIVGRLDNVLGGILDCQEKQINNLVRSDTTVHCTHLYCAIFFEYFEKIFSEEKQPELSVYSAERGEDHPPPPERNIALDRQAPLSQGDKENIKRSINVTS